MKKRSKSDRSIEALQKSADRQGIRLQKADSYGDMTDSGVMEKMMKKGMKDRGRMM